MGRKHIEQYTEQPSASHCAVEGCKEPPYAEVANWDYAPALERIFRRRRELQSKRQNDPAILVCERHMWDPRLAELDWQIILVGVIE